MGRFETILIFKDKSLRQNLDNYKKLSELSYLDDLCPEFITAKATKKFVLFDSDAAFESNDINYLTTVEKDEYMVFCLSEYADFWKQFLKPNDRDFVKGLFDGLPSSTEEDFYQDILS